MNQPMSFSYLNHPERQRMVVLHPSLALRAVDQIVASFL